MSHMLWQLEIHAKSLVEHIIEDTQCKIHGCTQSLKLKAYFHVQIKLVFWKLFFIKSIQKHLNSFGYLGKPFIVFHSQCFQKSLCCVLIQSKVSFKNTGCWFFPKHVMSKKNFLFKSQNKLFIIYDYTNLTKYIKANVN